MPSEIKGLKFLVRALGSRNFRLFFFGQAVSLIGTWMQIIAMRWLVYRLTKSELMLGMVGFISDVPLFLLVPFAGVLADRLKRHRIMVVTQALSALQAAVLAALSSQIKLPSGMSSFSADCSASSAPSISPRAKPSSSTSSRKERACPMRSR